MAETVEKKIVYTAESRSIQDAITRLTAAARATDDLDASQQKNVRTQATVTSATATMARQYELAVRQQTEWLRIQNQYLLSRQQEMMQLQQLSAAANDNASSVTAMGKSFSDTVVGAADLANHLKLAALAAYALFPAFRQVANAGVATAVSAMGPAAASAAGTMIGVLTPALAFLARIAIPITAAVGAYKLLSAAVEQSRKDIEEMLALPDKAQKAFVSPEFFQTFINGSKELESALNNAANATKVELNSGWLQGDVTKDKVNEITKEVRSLGFELFTVDKQSQGAEIFKNATDQAAKIRGVVTLMSELNAMGEKTVALDVGAKMFGNATMDRIRQGSLTIDDMFKATQRLAGSDGDIFSNAMIARAKEVDDKMKSASALLAENMKPSYEAITSLVLSTESAWAGIVRSIGEAVGLLSKLRPGQTAAVPAILNDQVTGLQARLRDKGLTDQQRNGIEEQLRAKLTEMALIDIKNWGKGDTDPGPASLGKGGNIPLPMARPSQAPGLPTVKEINETKDAFERAIESAQRHTAQMIADAQAVNLDAGAHEYLRTEAALRTAATRAGIAVDEAATQKIREQAEEAGKAALALERARVNQQINFGRQTAFLSPEDVQIAQALAKIYPDVTTALNSGEAAAMRFNNQLKGINDAAVSAFSGLRQDLANGVDGMTALGNAGKKFIDTLADIATKKLASDLLSGVFGGLDTQSTTAAVTLTAGGQSAGAALIAGATTAAGILQGAGALAGSHMVTGGAGSMPVPTFGTSEATGGMGGLSGLLGAAGPYIGIAAMAGSILCSMIADAEERPKKTATPAKPAPVNDNVKSNRKRDVSDQRLPAHAA